MNESGRINEKGISLVKEIKICYDKQSFSSVKKQ